MLGSSVSAGFRRHDRLGEPESLRYLRWLLFKIRIHGARLGCGYIIFKNALGPTAQSARESTTRTVWPSVRYLPGYVAALQRGWSADNIRGAAAAQDELAAIARDADEFLARKVDREAKGPPVVMPDGTTFPRLPAYARWLWDGEFCGAIGFRWQPGTPVLPPHVLGHIGYTVVPWKRGRRYATQALKALLVDVKAEGLPYVELTADADNLPSQRVITANGGVLVEKFRKPVHYGGAESLRFRINLPEK